MRNIINNNSSSRHQYSFTTPFLLLIVSLVILFLCSTSHAHKEVKPMNVRSQEQSIEDEKLKDILAKAHKDCLNQCSSSITTCSEACTLLDTANYLNNPNAKSFQHMLKVLASKGSNPAKNFLKKLKEAAVLPRFLSKKENEEQ
jgi:hypothetical protein